MVNTYEEWLALEDDELFVMPGGFTTEGKGAVVFTCKSSFHNWHLYQESVENGVGLTEGLMMNSDSTAKTDNQGWVLNSLGFNSIRYVKKKQDYQVRFGVASGGAWRAIGVCEHLVRDCGRARDSFARVERS